jgi:uncharacterized protein (DUF305 family)
MGGNKKNKRGSIPSSSTTTSIISTELIERTPENDYGVLSDPEENHPSSPVPLLTKEGSDNATHPLTAATAATAEKVENTHTPSEPSQLSHSPQRTQQLEQPLSPLQPPSPQQSSPSLQSQKQQTQAPLKSLAALQLKLSRDKNFSRKMTLHTFFSYVILAIEMQRACSSSIARISPRDVQDLVEYMIEHHSATEDVRTYLQTLIDTKVIHNLIDAIIEFNKDQTDALDKLITMEEIELQAINENTKDESDPATSTNTHNTNTTTTTTTTIANTDYITIAVISSNPESQTNLPQTPQPRIGFFQRMRSFFSGCCGCK